MKHLLYSALIAVASLRSGDAQEWLRQNVQVHGYATEGFLYTSSNNWNTIPTSSGSGAWTESVMNLTAQPQSKLRLGAQARYFLLGSYGKTVILDWAQADYKINEKIGIRAGKVKSPTGLLNETQDIDPAHLWILLPQSVYPIASRTTLLSHWGAVAYGSVPLGERRGKIEYRGFGGEQIVAAEDGVLQPERDNGTTFPSGLSGKVYGAALRWRTPITGLLVGASAEHERHVGAIVNGSLTGRFDSGPFLSSFYYALYEHNRWMVAGEYNRFPPNPTSYFDGFPPAPNPSDARNWYVMTSWKLTPRLTAGSYYSYTLDRKAPLDQNRYQKDWTFSGRYDLRSFLYLKAEQHVVNGTQVGFSSLDNGDGLNTKFNMSLLKLGAIF